MRIETSKKRPQMYLGFFLPFTKTVNYLTSLFGGKKEKKFEKLFLSEWLISELVSKQSPDNIPGFTCY